MFPEKSRTAYFSNLIATSLHSLDLISTLQLQLKREVNKPELVMTVSQSVSFPDLLFNQLCSCSEYITNK